MRQFWVIEQWLRLDKYFIHERNYWETDIIVLFTVVRFNFELGNGHNAICRTFSAVTYPNIMEYYSCFNCAL